MDKILKVVKRLKTFTLEDIVMFCEIDAETAESFLLESENKNSDITVTDACISFLNVSQSRNIKQNTVKAYKTFINVHIIPYFKGFALKDITVSDAESFRKCMQHKQISERRIKNILTLLNQIIKHFQNEGYIDKTCIFEVKRIAYIPKRQIQILTPEQLTQLFKIINKKYPYLTPIIKNLITLKQPLNIILTGSEQQKKSQKRKIRKDFYKIKRELGLTNYMFEDLRFSNLDN